MTTKTSVNPDALLCLRRPARIAAGEVELDAEFRAARWTYHRLLDIEDEHQAVLNETSEKIAPGMARCGRLVAKLKRRARRRLRTTAGQWSPSPRTELLARLQKRLAGLKEKRNSDPAWKVALSWFDQPSDTAPERAKARRKAGETDEAFAERCSKRRNRLTRREERRAALYETRRVHWSTWNALLRAVDQARAAVLAQRKGGMPAEWRRPRWDDPCTITAEPGCWRIIEQGSPWWVIELRLRDSWVRIQAKCGNWHAFAPSNIRRMQLTRRKNGSGWDYCLTAAVAGVTKASVSLSQSGCVALDWGHREHGHPADSAGLRVFTWLGDDGAHGEVILPRECRELLDAINDTKSRMDTVWNARSATLELPPQLGRYGYRKALLRSGVLSNEESSWLVWETRCERRLAAMRDRVQSLRRETYLMAIQELRRRYSVFAIEDETIKSHRKHAKEEMADRRKRSNRELSARYEFVQICERYGATIVPVPSRNSTRECPDCGELGENGPELVIACKACGRTRDKDYGACRVILRRAQDALEKQRATAENQNNVA